MRRLKIEHRFEDITDEQMDVFLSGITPEHICGFDTETTGLHIIKDKPFVFSCGYYHKETLLASAASIQLGSSRSIIFIQRFFDKCRHTTIAHNVKFDMHMLMNIQYEIPEHVYLSDTTFLIRWGTDNVQEKNGGAPLALKQFVRRYIDSTAGEAEQVLKKERTKLKRELKREVDYSELNRKNVLFYANQDIFDMFEVHYLMYNTVMARENGWALWLEEQLIKPLFEMERVGFDVDINYLVESGLRTSAYIDKLQVRLKELAGMEVNIGQHKLIKEVLNTRFNLNTHTTNKDVLELKSVELERSGENPEALKFIKLLGELRTLEKWYSTYIMRWLNDSHNGKVYTQINQVGTVSGRVTSDFQQFPKEGIFTEDGEELFIPRKMVVCPGGDYDAMVYLDYSQIELRIQALYTILVGTPDYNLCRAYMPYDCKDSNGELFDYNKDITRWDKETWYDNKTGEPWTPTDVHGETTKHAFDIDENHPDFKKLRSVGKRVNFAKNYGATYRQIEAMFPHYPASQIRKIDEAYYKAFPGVKAYHKYCENIAIQKPFVTNVFGVKYYNVSGHNLKNMLVQGSAATLLKLKILEIYKFRKRFRIKSLFQMNIHDENSFLKHYKESMNVFVKIKEIMEDWKDAMVPIVADVEVSETTWADKRGWHG